MLEFEHPLMTNVIGNPVISPGLLWLCLASTYPSCGSRQFFSVSGSMGSAGISLKDTNFLERNCAVVGFDAFASSRSLQQRYLPVTCLPKYCGPSPKKLNNRMLMNDLPPFRGPVYTFIPMRDCMLARTCSDFLKGYPTPERGRGTDRAWHMQSSDDFMNCLDYQSYPENHRFHQPIPTYKFGAFGVVFVTWDGTGLYSIVAPSRETYTSAV